MTLAMLLLVMADPITPRWRIHAEVAPVSGTFRSSPGEPFRHRSFSAGLGNRFGIGFGFLPVPHVALGLCLDAGFSSSRSQQPDLDNRWTDLAVAVLPYIEARPLPWSPVQPFLGLEGGAGYTRSSSRVSGDRVVHGTVTPQLGGRMGLRAFVLPRLSIDVAAVFSHQWQLPRPRTSTYFGDGYTVSINRSSSRTVQLAAHLGLTGWF